MVRQKTFYVNCKFFCDMVNLIFKIFGEIISSGQMSV